MTYLVIQYGANVVFADVFSVNGLRIWTSEVLDPMFEEDAAAKVERQALEYIASAH